MSPQKTWPVAVRRESSVTFIGVADRLGDGRTLVASPQWPALEQIAGDDWSARVLAALLPADRGWGWWTRAEVFDSSGLARTKAPAVVDPATLQSAVCRSKLLARMVLAIVPPRREEQERVLEWAACDTEHVADIIVTSTSEGPPWNVDDVVRWCADRTLFDEPESQVGRNFERILIAHDSYFYLALSHEGSEHVLEGLRVLASEWSIATIAAAPEAAWITPRPARGVSDTR
jgi:hypothetical protein